jgi:ectoine hydroxylase-related dioxygenase (phytanoyl-CoA dioxygenase family)
VTVPVSIENGATEFMVGSHRQPAKNFGDLELTKAEVPLGSALVFNGKINHRGTKNESLEDRPVIYRVFHKKWYNDQFRKGIDE